jgi:hypothetical protein
VTDGGQGPQVRRRDGVLSNPDGDTLLLLDLRGSRYLTLNRTGGRLWEALAAPCTVDGLVEVLVATEAVSAPEARAAVEAFLDALAVRDLLDRV